MESLMPKVQELVGASNIDVPPRTIAQTRGALHRSWQDRFSGKFGAGRGHAGSRSQPSDVDTEGPGGDLGL